MKIKLTPQKYIDIGEHREKKLYALWPVKINREIRWLEWITVMQRYDEYDYCNFWTNIEFIDRQKIVE